MSSYVLRLWDVLLLGCCDCRVITVLVVSYLVVYRSDSHNREVCLLLGIAMVFLGVIW